MLCYKEVSNVQSISNWEKPDTTNEVKLFISLFYHLFVQYEIPNRIKRDIHRFAEQRNYPVGKIQLIFHFVNNIGLEYFGKFEFLLDRQVNILFNQAPVVLDSIAAFSWAVLRARGYSELSANRFMFKDKFSLAEINIICSDEFFSIYHQIPQIVENNSSTLFKLIKKFRWQINFNDFIEILKHPKLIKYKLKYDWCERLLLCLSKMPLVRSINNWKEKEFDNPSDLFQSLFYHLFVPYHIPPCVERSIDFFVKYKMGNYQLNDFDLLFYLVQGKGIHKFKENIFNLNRKQNFYFYQAPKEFKFPQAINWVKLRAIGYSERVATNLVELGFGKKIKEIDSNDIISFMNNNSIMIDSEINAILKFRIEQNQNTISVNSGFHNMNINLPPLFPNFSLKGRSINSVLKLIDKWKEHVKLKSKALNFGELKKSNVLTFSKELDFKIIKIEQILTSSDLIREGHQMQHCVGSYISRCWNGHNSIWSLTEYYKNGGSRKLLTIDLDESNKKIIEVKGKLNRLPKNEEQGWVKEWTNQEKLWF